MSHKCHFMLTKPAICRNQIELKSKSNKPEFHCSLCARETPSGGPQTCQVPASLRTNPLHHLNRNPRKQEAAAAAAAGRRRPATEAARTGRLSVG